MTWKYFCIRLFYSVFINRRTLFPCRTCLIQAHFIRASGTVRIAKLYRIIFPAAYRAYLICPRRLFLHRTGTAAYTGIFFPTAVCHNTIVLLKA